MRLINAQTLQFDEFFEPSIPGYVILSHTWDDGEVTFQDMATTTRPIPKKGYRKVIETCFLARQMGIGYVWVDTCCIDKTSSAELTESINSMFRWYKNALVCVAHLADLEASVELKDGIAKCRWSTRGWTLQELIAPQIIIFYDKNWCERGSKDDFCEELSAATQVPESVLLDPDLISKYSIAQRMSWASERATTRTEDMAYCLFGIFEVNMPLIYGEGGTRAFQRLQKEIIKYSNDTTIFAWNPTAAELSHEHCLIFASCPKAFTGSHSIIPRSMQDYNPEFSITNKGLRIQDRLRVSQMNSLNDSLSEYSWTVGINLFGGSLAVVHLRKLGPDLFIRQTRLLSSVGHMTDSHLGLSRDNTFWRHDDPGQQKSIYIMDSSIPPSSVFAGFREFGIRCADFSRVWGTNPTYFTRAIPHDLWDHSDFIFLPNKDWLVRGIRFNQNIGEHMYRLAIVLRPSSLPGLDQQQQQQRYSLSIWDTENHPAETARIFPPNLSKTTPNEDLTVSDLVEDCPVVWKLGNVLEIQVDGGETYRVTVSCEPEEVTMFSQIITMFSLRIVISKMPSDNNSESLAI
ncbi:heterokaryon incompatibility protein-domain-containing protein [Bombardia bombarda]|uniref:Heterokaryon incompatibility protein-domain-containing protein n=1 Tax=Bombardia bombarda TaxID=252184 RepID=A0AA39XIH2_9PEZI|nr:heterokaryon incompatibility protein-domain-containing protein [Bombardia bombarda]